MEKYTTHIVEDIVLLNDILKTPARFQSRLKENGKKTKNKIGYKGLEKYFTDCPKFDKPVDLKLIIYQTKRYPIDVDACLKTLLDFLGKYKGIIVDDNEKGIKSLNITYAKGYFDKKSIKLSIISR